MNVRKYYDKIQEKYNLLDGVQELFLYETYLKICKEYFDNNTYNNIAIYGAGCNTKEIVNSAIWKDLKNRVKVIIDNGALEKEILGIPIVKLQDLEKWDIEMVLISSWNYRDEMCLSLNKYFPKMKFFEPYKSVMKILPQIKIPFFEYKWYNKYQWFAKRRKELEKNINGIYKEKLLKELIHGYYAIYDWVDLKDMLFVYNCNNYKDNEKYLCLEKDILDFLTNIQKEIVKRKQTDCLIFIIDSLSKYVVNDMPYLLNWKKKGVSFDNYINEYPSTREVLTSLLTGWHSFKDKIYLDKKIKYEDSELLKIVEKNEIEIKLISATRSANNYSDINYYVQGIDENLLLTEVLFKGIEELLNSKKQQIIIMHSFDTVHPLHWNPISTELAWDVLWEEHKRRFQESVVYTDYILDFYLNLLEKNKGITKIIMGDHGINLETEYAYGVARMPIRGNIGLWDLETISPALMIWNENLKPKVIDKLISTNSFHKILNTIIQNKNIEEVLEENKFLWLEFVPGYDESWLENDIVKSNNYYLGLGMKGIISLQYLYANFEDGTERLFKIFGKELVECNDELELFIDIVGRENYMLCSFPEDLLKESFFKLHNKYYKKIFGDAFNKRGGIRYIIKNIDLEITEKCSLKCKDCFNCMQYYKKPKNISLNIIKESLDIFMDNVDMIMEVRILGGEPFMNKDLKEITKFVCNKKNINRVVIYTNATILPRKDELEVFQNEKVSFYITDYRLGEKQKIKQFEMLLEEYEIPYHVHKLEYWYKPGDIFDNHKSKEELESTYKFCWGRDCITLLDGKLFQCEFVANTNRLKLIPDYKYDYVNLFEKEDLKKKLVDFLYNKSSMKSCRWCNLTTEKVKPGIQMSDGL